MVLAIITLPPALIICCTYLSPDGVSNYNTATRGEKIDHESFAFEGMMIKMLWDKENFPEGLSSFVNVQRQFFDSFVGQTFKVSLKLCFS